MLAVVPLLTAGAEPDYAAWAGYNGAGTWTATAYRAVRRSLLPTLHPKDIADFCPGYRASSRKARARFWVGLLSAVARPESHFDPASRYRESFTDSTGQRVISRGLLQISFESANQEAYGCAIRRARDLHQPAVNLRCGVKILSYLVSRDGVIATYREDDSARGGGRYWSTLRQASPSFGEIQSFTRELAVCAVR